MSGTDCVARLASRVRPGGARGNQFEWPLIEERLGLRLPEDYILLVETLPDGWFREAVRINRPGHFNESRTDFLGFYAHQLEDMRIWRTNGRGPDWRGSFPYPIFPEPGGLLPWASRRRGEPVVWLTEEKNPEAWKIVLAEYDFTEWHVLPQTACEFLADVVDGRVSRDVLEVDLSNVPFRAIETTGTPAHATFEGSALSGRRRSSSNGFTSLSDLLGPPRQPRRADWAAAESRLGLTLPTDYKIFVDEYGPGTFCDIRITAPGAPGDFNMFELLASRKEHPGDFYKRIGIPLYPERNGIIAWGVTADGWTLGWAPTDPDQDRWGIVVSHPPRPGGFGPDTDPEPFLGHAPDLSFSTFLYKYADDSADLDIFLDRVPWTGEVAFAPAE